MTTRGKDQSDVLKKKDNVTQGKLGLQQWGDDGAHEVAGTGGGGTAERQARIQRGQRHEDEEEVND